MHPEKRDLMISAKLISHTCGVGDYHNKDIESIIAYCARISNPANQDNDATALKLIKYLLKHKHFSPFEMVNICLEIECPRDIARQILRHRSFTFQEHSTRYAEPHAAPIFIRDCRLQDPNNRQKSIETDNEMLKDKWATMQQQVINLAQDTYAWAISKGIAKECARVLLPEGLTMSRLYMNGTVRSWLHYLQIRLGEETQKEHRLVAEACLFELIKVFPLMKEAVNGKA